MDPNPNGLYTKQKQQRIGIEATSSATDSSHGDANKPSVKYPTDGWSTSLEKMPSQFGKKYFQYSTSFCANVLKKSEDVPQR